MMTKDGIVKALLKSPQGQVLLEELRKSFCDGHGHERVLADIPWPDKAMAAEGARRVVNVLMELAKDE